ncbi:O-antigen ligase family protein [Mesorhizobium sp. SB112]|uniref:O-antigen ligase family protein n=1 Tax=Mesorhizobium sp. SB112 TaxID=3151853 RepID=UPI003265B09B
MKLPVFAINLDRSKTRWANLSKAGSDLGIDIRRIAAVDGSAIDPKEWMDVDFESFEHRNGRSILPGEYGCYRSHLLALQEFLKDGAPFAIIIEDDVRPDAQTLERVEAILLGSPNFDVIKLVNHRTSLFIQESGTAFGDKVGRAIHGPQGSAAAYLVSRQGAQRLLDTLSVMSLPWDVALERFWAAGVEVFSVKDNILEFSEDRRNSLIASKADYRKVKYTGEKRISAVWFRLKDYARRVHHVLLKPERHSFQVEPSQTTRLTTYISEALAAITVLIFVSALWVESDAYRYAGIALVIVSLAYYLRVSFWRYDKPLIGPIGILCIAWAGYVAIRFGYYYSTHPDAGTGAAEGVYLLPLFYATLGYALFLYIRNPFWVAAAFIAICGFVLIFGSDYAEIARNARPADIHHNNTIHASIAVGFIALCSIPFAAYTLRREGLAGWVRTALLGMAAITFILALMNIYALRSKGVWLSFGIALPILVVLISLTDKNRTARNVAIAGLLVFILGTGALYENIWKAGGGVAVATSSLGTELASGRDIMSTMKHAISDDDVPESTNERLRLWVNALEIWKKHPIWGAGVSWFDEWENRKYKDPNYTLMHNGYLEIGMRYGLVGLLFYFTIFSWATYRVIQAYRHRLIDASAMQCFVATMIFFAITILSNSNNRLAIGESYMWFAIGFGFYCYYRLQQQGLVRPRTYF